MTNKEAFEKLELEESASQTEIRKQYQEFYNEFQMRITNAPTEHQRKLYQKKLVELTLAFETLGGESVDENIEELPGISASEPKKEEGKVVVAPAGVPKMTKETALKFLGLEEQFSRKELDKAYKSKLSACESGRDNAINESIRDGYREALIQCEAGYDLLKNHAVIALERPQEVDVLSKVKKKKVEPKKSIHIKLKKLKWVGVIGLVCLMAIFISRKHIIHALYSAEDLHGSYSAEDMHGIYSAEELHGVYSAEEIHGVYTAEEIHGVYTVEEIHGNYDAEEIHGIYKAEDLHGVYTVEDLHGVYTAEELHGVYTAEELHGVYTAEELHGVYSAEELHGVYTIEELHGVYFVEELHGVYSLEDMIAAGYEAKDLHIEFSRKELASYFNSEELMVHYGVGIGDFYQGGIVFEIDSSGKHGKVVSKKDIGNFDFSTAKRRCEGLTLNGYTDWRLPTLKEFELININKTNAWGLGKKGFWTSTCVWDCKYHYIFAFGWIPVKGLWGTGLEDDYITEVRAVRAF